MNPETRIQSAIIDALSALPFVKLWRNNTGRRGRVSFGLAVGSSDLIGIVRTVEGVGRFLGLEVKVPGEEATDDQKEFLRFVRELGGVAEVVTSPAEALAVVMRARNGGA